MILLLSRACYGTQLRNFLFDAKFELQADYLPNGVNKFCFQLPALVIGLHSGVVP
jgi:hypothetical protein